MKSQRRHELEQNELAQWAAGSAETLKPYTNAILGSLLLVLIVAVAVVLWIQRGSTETAQAWEDFYSAMVSGTPAELQQVAEDYEGTDVGHWANVISGDLHLGEGCNQLFSSRAGANQELTKAVDNYLTVINQSKQPMLRQRATFGLARAREAQGKLDEALKYYQSVAENWPDGPFAVMAGRRIADLRRPATKAFYDNFARFDPKPAFSDEPGTPGMRLPFDETSLPDDGLFEPLGPLELKQEEPSKPQQADEEPKPDDATKPEPANKN